jgi:hypothetical protein
MISGWKEGNRVLAQYCNQNGPKGMAPGQIVKSLEIEMNQGEAYQVLGDLYSPTGKGCQGYTTITVIIFF